MFVFILLNLNLIGNFTIYVSRLQPRAHLLLRKKNTLSNETRQAVLLILKLCKKHSLESRTTLKTSESENVEQPYG